MYPREITLTGAQAIELQRLLSDAKVNTNALINKEETSKRVAIMLDKEVQEFKKWIEFIEERL